LEELVFYCLNLYCSGQKYWAEVDNNFLRRKTTEMEIERNSPEKR